MEGKDYPTRSKSGVRKTRTPWDNSSSVLFDQLVGVKRSPKTPPTDGKGGHTPSPKVGGKKTPSSAGKASAKEKKASPGMSKVSKTMSPSPIPKVKVSPATSVSSLTKVKTTKLPPSSSSSKKKTTPSSSRALSPQRVLYDFTHSPASKITAVSLSASASSSARSEVSGVSPRSKFGSLFKAQKPKLSKTEHQKLKESLKIFDFGSDSESEREGEEEEEDEEGGEDEGVLSKTKPRRPPPVAKETKEKKEVKGDKKEAVPQQKKQQNNANYRRAPVRQVIAKIVPNTSSTTKTTTSPKKSGGGGGGGKRKRGDDGLGGGGGGGGKRKKGEEGGAGGGAAMKRKRGEEAREGEGGGGAKKTRTENKTEKEEEEEEEAVDLSHYENYPRLTRAAYRNIERMGPVDSPATESVSRPSAGDNNSTGGRRSTPQPSDNTSSLSTPHATPIKATPIITSSTSSSSLSQDVISEVTTPPKPTTSPPPTLTTSLITHPPTPHVSSRVDHVTSDEDHMTSETDHTTSEGDHVTSEEYHMTSHDQPSVVVEEPVTSVVHTEEQELHPQIANEEDAPLIRSFTPPPLVPGDSETGGGVGTEYGNQKTGGTGNGSGPTEDGTLPLPDPEEEEETMETETQSAQKKEEEEEEERGKPGDLSLSEPLDKPGFSDFDRHLTMPTVRKTLSSAVATLSPTKTYSGATFVPSLSRASTWPKAVPSRPPPSQPEKESQLCTVVRNVRQAHECLESGENQQFFDDMEYIMDSLQQSQPLNVRCLGTCNLATQCLRSEFSQQIRAHEFIPKITSALKDLLDHPTLSLTSAVLFYVMTRDKYNSDWDKAGIGLLCGLLKETTAGLEQRLGGVAKVVREWDRMLAKAKSILEKVGESGNGGGGGGGGGGEGGEEGGEEEGGEAPIAVKTERKPSVELFVEVDKIEVSELSRECLLSLTAPVNSPHWIREELRISGGLDILANMAIESYSRLEEGEEGEEEGGGGEVGEKQAVRKKLLSLERILKCLENVTLMNRDNQSYLVIFDGSLLITKLLKMLSLCQKIITSPSADRIQSVSVLLAVLRVLLNLTHDNELGSHRLGEQEGAVKTVLDIIFMLCDDLPDEHRFDTLVLGLGLLINMIEHNTANRQQLERLPVTYSVSLPRNPSPPPPSRKDDTSGKVSGTTTTEVKSDESVGEERRSLMMKEHNTCVKSLISLFLKHYLNAEGATIEVPTPQRLSQISASSSTATPHTSPQRQGGVSTPSAGGGAGAGGAAGGGGGAGGGVRRDLTPSFADRLKAQNIQREKRSKERRKKRKRVKEEGEGGGGDGEQPDSQDSQKTEVLSDSSESEVEDVGVDPLVFSRDDFDTALSQAGQQMEDSVVAAYCALVLGLLAKHNLDTVDVVRSGMPSRTFSEMMAVLRKFVSFMNLTGSSGTGLENVRRIIKFLEAV